MTLRACIAALTLLAGLVASHLGKPPDPAGLQRPLHEFPAVMGDARGEDHPFEARVVQTIGADDYINRAYLGSTPAVELYIGYYKDQRSGDKMHSPKNCLPGSGWEPVHSSRVQIGSLNGVPLVVNAYLVAQGNRRDMVLYWYQTHGRVIASEYAAKFWLVADSLNRRSTDGAMIRIWTTASDGEETAQARAVDFASRVYPQVAQFLPN